MQEAGADERQREGSAVLGPVACNSTTTRLAEAEAVALAPNQLGVDQDVQQARHLTDRTAASLPYRQPRVMRRDCAAPARQCGERDTESTYPGRRQPR